MQTQGQALAPLLGKQAVALYRAGRRQEALATCRQALAAAPKQPDLLGLAGTLAMELGNAAEAVSFFRAAVQSKPDFAECHYNLGNALVQLGKPEEAVEAYRRAAKYRNLVPIHNNLGNALQALKRWDEAAAAYRRALKLDDAIPDLHRNLGIVLQGAGRLDEAIAEFRRTLALKSDWSLAYSSLANALFEKGDARGVVEVCDAWLRMRPGTLEAIGLKALALGVLGDGEGARYLVDLDRFVRVHQFETPPEDYTSMNAFNAALAEHALNHPTLHLPPPDDPRYHCPTLRITGEFLAEPKGPAAVLEVWFREAVTNYLGSVAQRDLTHPFLVNPPRRWKLTSWAAVLDRQGNLVPHCHYDGFVSGVYYPKIPDFIGAPGQGEAGWFELGRAPEHLNLDYEPEIRAIRPRQGMLILFPSYFFHRTVPFEGNETRISIAFDTMPLG